MNIKQKSFRTISIKSGESEILLNPDSKIENSIAIFPSDKINYTKVDENSLVINSAGEYESKDIFITGKKIKQSEEIVYQIDVDDLHVGYIDYVKQIDQIPIDFFESCDILILSAGGGREMFTPKDAYELIQKISPKAAVVFGIKDQIAKEKYEDASDLEALKAAIPNLKLSERVLRISKSDAEDSDNMDIYYFEV